MDTSTNSSSDLSSLSSQSPLLAPSPVRSTLESPYQLMNSEQSITSDESHDSTLSSLSNTPEPVDLDWQTQRQQVLHKLHSGEDALSDYPSDLEDTNPYFHTTTTTTSSSSPASPKDPWLDPILLIPNPLFGQIPNLTSTSPLCDIDDLLRLASRQTAQEITDQVNQLRPWSVTKREVQQLIQMALKRVARSRDVNVKAVNREFEEVRRRNGVGKREVAKLVE